MQMMKCKAALIEADGDMDKAVEILRKSNKDAQDKFVSRETAEGRIGVFIDPAAQVGAIVEVRCESAPVAKSDLFIQLANDLAKQVALKDPPSVEALLAQPFVGRPEQDRQRAHRRGRRPDPREHEAGALHPADGHPRQLRPPRRLGRRAGAGRGRQGRPSDAARRVACTSTAKQPAGRAARGRGRRPRRQGDGDRADAGGRAGQGQAGRTSSRRSPKAR